MELLWVIAGYLFVSLTLYVALRARCRKNPVFRMPRRKWVFYLLSFTWGLPMVLFGALVALFLLLFGHRPVKCGWEWCFEIPKIDWGTELGLFFIAPPGHERIKMHEHGHGIQNIYLGIFAPLVVSVPSFMRFWFRRLRERRGKPCRTDYDSVWFEQSASESGKAFFDQLKDGKNSEGPGQSHESVL